MAIWALNNNIISSISICTVSASRAINGIPFIPKGILIGITTISTSQIPNSYFGVISLRKIFIVHTIIIAF